MQSLSVNTADVYVDINTLVFPRAVNNVNLTVTGAIILANFFVNDPSVLGPAQWSYEEIEMIPGVWTVEPPDVHGELWGVRVRSLLTGNSGRVAMRGA